MTTGSRTATPSDLEGLLDELGIEYKSGYGDEIIGWCPQHAQRTGQAQRRPHWSINRRTGASQCFSCGYRAGLQKLVCDSLGGIHKMWEAQALIRRHGIAFSSVDPTPHLHRTSSAARPEFDLSAYSAMVPVPEERCAERHLDPDWTWAYGVRWEQRQRRWIIPIFGFTGTLMGWQEKGTNVFLNRPTSVRKSLSLFGYQEIVSPEQITIVESPLDVVRLRSAGIPNAVASYGASVSEEQIAAILEHTNKVCLAFDNDTAGQNEAERLLARYRKRIRFSLLGYGHTQAKDPGEMSDPEITVAFATTTSALVRTVATPAARRVRGSRGSGGVGGLDRVPPRRGVR